MSNLNLHGVDTYGGAARFLGDRDEKVLVYATKVRRVWTATGGWAIEVVHHKTPIIRYYSDGDIYIQNGGYVSRTTSNRLHRLTPPGVVVSFAKGGSVTSEHYTGPQPHTWKRVA